MRRVSLRIVLPCLLLAVAAYLRATSVKRFGMLYDEGITRALAANIWKGDWRNNWKHIDGVPTPFRIDCYNFSSYMYADALAAGSHSRHPLWRERLFSSACGTLACAAFFFVAALFFDWWVANAALAIMAVFPLLVQDAHYARPEAFATLLCGILYLLCAAILRRTRPLHWFAAAAFCCGFLIACKISFVPLAALPFACLLARKQLTLRTIAYGAFLLFMGTFAGVPDAFIHPASFWSGVQMLSKHYGEEHPPHSSITSLHSFGLTSLYFWQTLGSLCCLFCLLGTAFAFWRKNYFALTLVAVPLLFYFLYFCMQRVFFERNLSHIAPLIAILAGFGLVSLARLFPPRWHALAASVLLGVALIRPAQISAKLVFIAMRESTEQRAARAGYSQTIAKREGLPIGPESELLVGGHVEQLVTMARQSASDLIIPTRFYNDEYTVRGLHELQRKIDAHIVGEFPSLFPGPVPNTLVVYHSPGLRYVRLKAPGESEINGAHFSSWKAAIGKIEVRFEPGTWVTNGAHPGARIPSDRDIFFGSFTPQLGDTNRGEMHIGPFELGDTDRIGIPFITGPNSQRLSITVYKHSGHRLLASLNPPPVLASWMIWSVGNLGRGEFDIVARDEGSDWGEWLCVGLPLRLKPLTLG